MADATDEGQTPTASAQPETREAEEREPRRSLIRDLIGQSAVVLAALGVLLYGISSFGYNAYYHSLGIEANDVGLGYGSVLARSTSLGTLLIILGVFTVTYWLLFSRLMGWIHRRTGESLARRFSALQLISFGFLIVFVLLVWISAEDGRQAAQNVMQGGYNRLTSSVFGRIQYTAMPATITPIGDADDVARINSGVCGSVTPKACQDRLLYLGQANGIVVLYNVTKQRSVYLPSSLVVLQISNCGVVQSQPDDAACAR